MKEVEIAPCTSIEDAAVHLKIAAETYGFAVMDFNGTRVEATENDTPKDIVDRWYQLNRHDRPPSRADLERRLKIADDMLITINLNARQHVCKQCQDNAEFAETALKAIQEGRDD